MKIDLESARMSLVAAATLGAPLSKLSSNTYDDRFFEALLKLAMNNNALGYVVDIVELFTEPKTPEQIDEGLAKLRGK